MSEPLISTDRQLDAVLPFDSFQEASSAVLRLLQQRIGFDLWLLTRAEGEDWIVLDALDRSYGVERGDVFRWTDSFCSRMVEGQGPRIAPDSEQVEVYRSAPIGQQVPIGAYVGVPLTNFDGSLFGTLCAIDPATQPRVIENEVQIIEAYARLLSTILGNELERQEQARRLEQAEVISQTDSLTGLFNHRGWMELLDVEEKRCQRYGHPVAIVLVDLDDLKSVNDTRGHEAGDALLIRAAGALRETLRDSDVVGRIGGDEFAVMAAVDSAQAVERLEDRVKDALAEAGVAASVGAACRDPRRGLEATQRLADERMYDDKRR